MSQKSDPFRDPTPAEMPDDLSIDLKWIPPHPDDVLDAMTMYNKFDLMRIIEHARTNLEALKEQPV